MDAHIVFECEVCWARAESAEAIEHQPVIHPPDPQIVRYEFPYVREPSAGLFNPQA